MLNSSFGGQYRNKPALLLNNPFIRCRGVYSGMEEVTSKLDDLLQFIAEKYPTGENALYFNKALPSIDERMKKRYPDIQFSEIQRLLNQLIKDEYIDTGKSQGISFYFLTVKGDLIVISGGYRQKALADAAESIRLRALETSQHDTGRRLNVLTAVISVGTAILALIELVKMTHDYHWWPFGK
jgi:hypothetical protein